MTVYPFFRCDLAQTGHLDEREMDEFDDLRATQLAIQSSIWQMAEWGTMEEDVVETLTRDSVMEEGHRLYRRWLVLWERFNRVGRRNSEMVWRWEEYRRGVMWRARRSIGSDICAVCFK